MSKLTLAIICTVLAFGIGGFGIYKSVVEHKAVTALKQEEQKAKAKAKIVAPAAQAPHPVFKKSHNKSLAPFEEEKSVAPPEVKKEVPDPIPGKITQHLDQATIGNYFTGIGLLIQALGLFFANRHQHSKRATSR
jgi:hypothetical protein